MKNIGVELGVAFTGVGVGHAVTMKRGVPEGVAAAVGVMVGNAVKKNAGVRVADAVGEFVGVADTEAISCPTIIDTPHAAGVSRTPCQVQAGDSNTPLNVVAVPQATPRSNERGDAPQPFAVDPPEY
jgi:hypothetical protein